MVERPYFGEQVMVRLYESGGWIERLGRVVWYSLGEPCSDCGDYGCNMEWGENAVHVELLDGREIRAPLDYAVRPLTLLEWLAQV